MPNRQARTLSTWRLFHNYITSIWRKCTAHDFAAHWHSMIPARVSADPPVKFASVDLCAFPAIVNRFIHHPVHLHPKVISRGHC
jgi:hypothetical protein